MSPPDSSSKPTNTGSARKRSPRAAAKPINSLRPEVRAVLMQIRELLKISAQHFQSIEASCGVSGSQLWMMSELQAKPGLKISELATALSVHLSTASNLLDKLEIRGLIRRERRDTDQRVVRVYLTEEGETIIRKAPQPVQGVIPDALGKMPADALQRLHQDLETLLGFSVIRDRNAALTPLADLHSREGGKSGRAR